MTSTSETTGPDERTLILMRHAQADAGWGVADFDRPLGKQGQAEAPEAGQWLLDSGELERAAGLELTPEHSRVMICGNPQMIDDIRQRLKARGLNLSLTRRPGQVAVENYW